MIWPIKRSWSEQDQLAAFLESLLRDERFDNGVCGLAAVVI